MVAVRGEPTLVQICDTAGRTRGTGFAADDLGTLVTGHDVVDGLGAAVVRTAAGRSYRTRPGDIVPLPEWGLALVRTNGLGLAPAVFGAERACVAGTDVRVPLGTGRCLQARLGRRTPSWYASTQGTHRLGESLELPLPAEESTALRQGSQAPGTPVVDAATGAVLAVLSPSLHACGPGPAGVPGPTGVPESVRAPGSAAALLAVPLRGPGLSQPYGPLGALLARNGACVPGFGPDLNLAGALELTATSVGPAVARAGAPVERPGVAAFFREFERGHASVAALVGSPGTGRSTELAILAARRARGAEPVPTVWLRGADLRPEDGSVREAVGRALAGAGRIVTASRAEPCVGDPAEVNPDVVARLARDAHRPLLVLLDAPEEMPPGLAHSLRGWTAGTASWLRASGARMAVACRPEYWEQAGALFPAGMLHASARTGSDDGGSRYGAGLPPCLRLGDLPSGPAARARSHHGLPDAALGTRDAGHPLVMRMLAEIRAAQAGGGSGGRSSGASEARDGSGGYEGCAVQGARGSVPEPAEGVPDRSELFAAYLGLMCLRIAVRLAAGLWPVPSASAVRRLAAAASGRLHEAARRCLGPGQGELDRGSFEEIFPWNTGWASAVLAEEALVPAGEGYRFADEELGDWIQGCHLDLDAALDALIHRRADGGSAVPVPRHRIGPVVQALLLCGRTEGPRALADRLWPLLDPAADIDGDGDGDGGDAAWWAAQLLVETLRGVPDARPYLRLLHALAGRINTEDTAGEAFEDTTGEAPEGAAAEATGPGSAARGDPVAHGVRTGRRFGPSFWGALPLPAAERLELLRLLLPADPPHGGGRAAGPTEPRFLDAVGELLTDEPGTVRPLLTGWFSDARRLRARAGAQPGDAAAAVPTVAAAAQALLYAHRGHDVDGLLDVLFRAAHPRADELLDELLQEEPAALCRAVARWSEDAAPDRLAAAAAYGYRALPLARTAHDRSLLRRAAADLLCRDDGAQSRSPALALLVRDGGGRSPYLATAVDRFAATGAPELAEALGHALARHPDPVLHVVRARMHQPGPGAYELVEALAGVRDPVLAPRVAGLVRAYADLRPETAGEAVAAFVRCRLGHGTEARGTLVPLVTGLLRAQHAPFRACLARALGGGEGPLRAELLEVLLESERVVEVLDSLLEAVVRRYGRFRDDESARLVRRIGRLLAGTPDGAAGFDQRLLQLARENPGFARLVRRWIASEPGEWTALVGQGTPGLHQAPAGPQV